MDPVARAVSEFQQSFREYRSHREIRVLRVLVDAADLSALATTLRGEEFQPENRNPFLSFTAPYQAGGAGLVAMTHHLYQHYSILAEGLAKEGAHLEPLGQLGAGKTAFQQLVMYLARWVECTAPVIEPPLLCWLPPAVDDQSEFRDVVIALINQTDPSIQFVIADDSAGSILDRTFDESGVPAATVAFRIDQDEMKNEFARMMLATPKKGRAPGTPPGAAAPDVEPPPRPGPQAASDEQVRATLAEHGLPPVLTPGDGEELQTLVFAAARAVADGNSEVALGKQYEAYQLCDRSGVKLEQGMMALLLGGYLVQFQQEDQALQWYQEAARLTGEANAHAQVSQSLIGVAYIHFQAGRFETAAGAYHEAARAAAEGGATLLVLENLRMVGVCLQRLGRMGDAVQVWLQAVEQGRQASPGEISTSNFHWMTSELKTGLQQLGMRPELDYVQAVEQEMAAAVEPQEVAS